MSRRLRPHILQIVGMFIPTGILIFASLSVWNPDKPAVSLILVLVFCPVSLYVLVRWVGFAGVRRHGDDLIVTGMFWSRRIPLARIERVTFGYVSVRWRNRRGSRILTPVTALWSEPRSLDFVTRHSHEAVSKVRVWVAEASKDA